MKASGLTGSFCLRALGAWVDEASEPDEMRLVILTNDGKFFNDQPAADAKPALDSSNRSGGTVIHFMAQAVGMAD